MSLNYYLPIITYYFYIKTENVSLFWCHVGTYNNNIILTDYEKRGVLLILQQFIFYTIITNALNIILSVKVYVLINLSI